MSTHKGCVACFDARSVWELCENCARVRSPRCPDHKETVNHDMCINCSENLECAKCGMCKFRRRICDPCGDWICVQCEPRDTKTKCTFRCLYCLTSDVEQAVKAQTDAIRQLDSGRTESRKRTFDDLIRRRYGTAQSP
jgi:hypothetical protein